jgi:hypothetical protein
MIQSRPRRQLSGVRQNNELEMMRDQRVCQSCGDMGVDHYEPEKLGYYDE